MLTRGRAGSRLHTSDRMRYVLAHRKRLVLGLMIIAAFLLSAILADVFPLPDPLAPNLRDARQPPSAAHVLGTDEMGRDMLTRVLYGGRVTFLVAVVSLAIACVCGCLVGVIAGLAGGATDSVLMRLIDVQLAFPGIIFAIAIISVVGPGIPGLIMALALYPIASFARLSRALTLGVVAQDYIEAARSVGVVRSRLILRHILPNIAGPLLVQASVSLPGIILIGSSLGFLGLGVQPPTPEWGAMLSRARDYINTSPHMGIFPGAAVTLVVFGFTVLGDALQDMLDPRLRSVES